MTTKPSFILYSLNYAPELTGIGKYNGEMAAWLVSAGYNVDVICAPPYYPEWRIQEGYSSWRYRKEFIDGVTVTRCPIYIPASLNTIKRLIHLLSFALSSAVPLFRNARRKAATLIIVEPTLLCIPLGLLYCWLTGTRSILHIQDYEIDAMFGLEVSKGRNTSLLKRLAFYVERKMMEKFDIVSTISNFMLQKARLKGIDSSRLVYFPNWSDTKFIGIDACTAEIRRKWDLQEEDRVVLYAGNIGTKQGIEILLDAAKEFENQKNVKFFVVGAGSQSTQLVSLSKKRALNNVYFKPLVEWAEVPAMLRAANVHLVLQRKGACDAVMPSKLTNILSAGGYAVVTADEATELGQIELNNPGIYECVEPENVQALVDGIKKQLDESVNHAFNRVAREYALKFLNKDAIISRYLEQLTVVNAAAR